MNEMELKYGCNPNQKPAKITKQKADKQKKVKLQNVNRAKKLGIQYIPNKI